MKGNPFAVTTPEVMSADEIVKLFVKADPDIQLNAPGHLFVHGHRGSGKSMALRLLSPDCQTILQNRPLNEHSFFAVYATVKATELDIHEFSRIQDESSGFILAEHLLVTFFAGKLFRCMLDMCLPDLSTPTAFEQLKNLVTYNVVRRLKDEGLEVNIFEEICAASDSKELLGKIQTLLDDVHIQTVRYLRRRGTTQEFVAYDGPLLGFQDFLLPLLRNLKTIKVLPQGPVYLLVDDADNLNLLQTLVLNTWVSYRTTEDVSLKISTQLRYKTYSTTTGNRIEIAHDYAEVNAFSMFTGGNGEKYANWVRAVVEKRLLAYGIVEKTADQFFPPDEAQENAIRELANKRKAEWPESGTGARPGDDAYRYARPDYIKSLGGTAKVTHTYRYAGFDQLVHVSSGIVRHFLESASRMYAKQSTKDSLRSGIDSIDEQEIDFIQPAVQDDIVRALADELMEKEFDKLLAESDPITGSRNVKCTIDDLKNLKTLIKSLGGIFYEVLISDRSERRVLTFALSNTISDRVEKVIRLGVENGYFYESYVGSKDGRSRTRRYVLTRRIAPYFKLDPTGFSGYLFVTNELLHLAIDDDIKAIAYFRSNRLNETPNDQTSLFTGEHHAE